MNSNEALRLAYTHFVMQHDGETELRKKFSQLLRLPVGVDTARRIRCHTLDKWLAPSTSVNYRRCPDQIARFAQIMVILDEVLPGLKDCQPLSDEHFFALESIVKGENYDEQSTTDH